MKKNLLLSVVCVSLMGIQAAEEQNQSVAKKAACFVGASGAVALAIPLLIAAAYSGTNFLDSLKTDNFPSLFPKFCTTFVLYRAMKKTAGAADFFINKFPKEERNIATAGAVVTGAGLLVGGTYLALTYS